MAADNRGQRSHPSCSYFKPFSLRGHPRTTKKLITKHATPRTTADMQNLGSRSRGQPSCSRSPANAIHEKSTFNTSQNAAPAADKPRTRLLYRKLTSEWSVHVPQPCDFTQIGRGHEAFMRSAVRNARLRGSSTAGPRRSLL